MSFLLSMIFRVLMAAGIFPVLTAIAACIAVCGWRKMLRGMSDHYPWQIDRELLLGLLAFSAGQYFGLHARQMPVAIFLLIGIGEAWHLDEALAAAELGPLPADAIAQLDQLRGMHPAFRK